MNVGVKLDAETIRQIFYGRFSLRTTESNRRCLSIYLHVKGCRVPPGLQGLYQWEPHVNASQTGGTPTATAVQVSCEAASRRHCTVSDAKIKPTLCCCGVWFRCPNTAGGATCWLFLLCCL